MMVKDSIETVAAKLEEFLTTKTVIGEPVTIGEVTLIPVVDVMFGFGAGGGEGKDSKGDAGTGGGGGGGARMAAKAVIVIKNGEVSVMPLSRGSAIEKIIEAVPGLLEKIQVKGADKQAEPEARKPE